MFSHIEKRRLPVVMVRLVEVRTGVDQNTHDLGVTVPRRSVRRRMLTGDPNRRLGVNIDVRFLSYEALHFFDVTSLERGTDVIEMASIGDLEFPAHVVVQETSPIGSSEDRLRSLSENKYFPSKK